MPDFALIPQYAEILTALESAWNAVHTEKTMRVVLIEGASGMKKSSLVYEFLRTSQAPSIVGRGSGVPEPYLPLRMVYQSMLALDVVQAQLQKSREDLPQEWKIALTTFAEVLRILHPVTNAVWEALKQWQSTSLTPTSSSDSADAETTETRRPLNLPELLTFALGDLTAILPVILFIDNLDISDAATLEALTRTMLPALKNNPLLLIATFDPERSAEQRFLEDFLEVVLQIPDHAHFKLAPLQAVEIAQFFAPEFGSQFQAFTKEQQNQFVQQIHRLSGGNLARIGDVSYYLRQTEARNVLAALEALPNFQALLNTLFQHFPGNVQTALSMAAAQGFYWCLPAVAAALEMPENELSALLSPLSEKPGTWLRQDSPVFLGQQKIHWYRFTGKAHHAVVYESLTAEKRQQEYHRKIAAALEQVYGDDVSAIPVLLASQCELGDLREKAAVYYAMAAQQSNNLGNLQQGFEYAEKGLHNLQELSMIPAIKTQRCRLLIQKGRAMQGTAQGHLALEVLREAYTLAQDEEINDQSLQAEAANLLGQSLLDQNRWDEGIEIMREALRLATRLKKWETVAQSMENLRGRFWARGKAAHKDFFVSCDQLIAEIQRDSTPQAQVIIAEILEDQGWLYHQRGENNLALEALQKAFVSLSLLEKPESYPQIHYKLHKLSGRILRLTDQYETALQEVEKAIRWAQVDHQRTDEAQARYEKAMTLRGLGRVAEGEQELEITLQQLQYFSDIKTLAQFEEDFGFFFSHTGRKRRAREIYQKSYEHRLTTNNLEEIQISLNNIAAIDKHLGEFQQALSTYKQLLNEGIAQGNKSRQSISLNHVGDIYRSQNQLLEAEQAHKKALELSDELHRIVRKAVSLKYLGRVYLVNWNLELAGKVLWQAEQIHQLQAGDDNVDYHETILWFGRLAICKGMSVEAITKINQALSILEKVQDLLEAGYAYLNLGLAHLALRDAKTALVKAEQGLKAFENTESWRVSEAHHFLARCYLALGELEQAQAEIAQAQALFMKLKLFHRVHQAENTEIKIEEARRNKKKLEEYRGLSLDELRQDFNHLGI